jgi:hypothetical protein
VRVRASSLRASGEAREARAGVQAGETGDVGSSRGFEQLLGPGERLEQLDGEAHERGVRSDVGGHAELVAPGAPLIRPAQVAQLQLHPVDRLAPAGTVPVLPASGRLPGEVPGVAGARRLEIVGLGQPELGELTDGLEQCVAGAHGGVVRDHERLADQGVEVAEHFDLVGRAGHRVQAREIEPSREDGRQAEQVLLIVGQEVVRPLHGVTEGEVSFRRGRRALQQAEPIREPVPHLDRAHGGHTRGRQLDAERKAVEVRADLGHRVRGLDLAQAEVGTDGAGALDEQGDRVGDRASLQRQRHHCERHFAVDREGLTRRRDNGDDPGPTQNRADRRSRRGQDVFAVVHDEEESATS